MTLDSKPPPIENDSFAALRRFMRPRSDSLFERCDLCGLEVPDMHAHLLEPANRQLHCPCQACAILFSNTGDGRFIRVPTTITSLPDFRLTDLQWAGLMLPIQLAFFFDSTPDKKVIALYPSPAGATESLLALEAWDEIVEQNTPLQKMQPDVEALLVNRVGDKREYFIAPIDECYKLVGHIRMKWHGLSGGTDTWQAIDGFFASLKERSQTTREAAHAGS